MDVLQTRTQMSLKSLLIIASIFLLNVVGEVLPQSINSPRLRNGQTVDSLKRFPHHVTIETVNNRIQVETNRLCGGSILSEHWILTSRICIDGSNSLQLHFTKLYYNSYNGSFTIVVNKDAIHMHPTNYYDIALINIPVRLVFSDILKPVNLSSIPLNELENRLAVMPGFDVQKTPALTTTTTTTTTTSGPEGSGGNWSLSTTDYSTTSITSDDYERDFDEPKSFHSYNQPHQQLMYGMFRILSNRRCKYIDSKFDEYLQICTENWVTSSDSSSCWNYGNGLLVGWPARSELVGIYSVFMNNCSSSNPVVYTSIAEFLPWIYSVINLSP